MRITIIHQYFKTPEEGGGIRSYYIAKYLASKGHDVNVVTAYNGANYSMIELEGFKIHYLPVYYTNHLTFSSRIHAFYRFVRKSIKLIKALPKSDFNYVISTPLSTGLIALHFKQKWNIPYVFEVGDLWPQAPIELGVIKSPLLKYVARRLEKRVYENAKNIVALSTDIKKAIEGIAPHKSIAVVTNMSDTEFFYPEKKKEKLVKKYHVEHKFVIAYVGTVGLANNLEYLLDVAKTCEYKLPVEFLIMGSGARWDSIKQHAKDITLSNMQFLEAGGKEEVREVLNITDAIYISFKNVPVLASGSPNKFFDGLAAGKLIITNFKGWILQVINQNACGFSYDPNNPNDFVQQLDPYINNAELLQLAQSKARQLADSVFAVDKQLAYLERFLFKES